MSSIPLFELCEEVTRLRGGCHCGRYRYVIDMPENGNAPGTHQVVIDTNRHHQLCMATPLPAFFRVPLTSFHTQAVPFFPDETVQLIARVYEPRGQAECTQRSFCGFCGTSITYWTENPIGEADYKLVTLGSLDSDALNELNDMGFVHGHANNMTGTTDSASMQYATSLFTGIPWFDALMRPNVIFGAMQNLVRDIEEAVTTDIKPGIQWEITEFTDDVSSMADSNTEEDAADVSEESSTSQADRKRKLQDLEGDAATVAV